MGIWFLALVGVLWCFEGFLEIVVVAGEVRRPARNLMRALVISVCVMAIVYLAYDLALILNLGLARMAQSSTVAADLAHHLFGRAGGIAVNAVVALATFSAALSLLFSGPRIVVAMSRGGLFPSAAGQLLKGRRTPALAIILCGLAALAYALVGSFEELVKYFSFATGLFSSLIIAGGVWLRAQGKIPQAARRIPSWPLPPIVAIVAALGGAVFVFRDQPRSSALGLVLLLVAIPLSRRLISDRTIQE